MNVLASAKYIHDHADNVKVNKEAILHCMSKIREDIRIGQFNYATWAQHALHPKRLVNGASEKEFEQDNIDLVYLNDDLLMNWIFVMDSLNFCFWDDNIDADKDYTRYTVEFKGHLYQGYWAWCALIRNAWEIQHWPILNMHWWLESEENVLYELFESIQVSKQGIPLLNERITIMREHSRILLNVFQGSFMKCVEQANHDASKLLSLLIRHFPSFRDCGTYKGKEVVFLKRAQILIGDIMACWENKGIGYFEDGNTTLTVFADYRLPQILQYLGILEYKEVLFKQLQNKIHLTQGSLEEMEIRGCTIWACELIRRELDRSLKEDPFYQQMKLNAVLLDYYLWDKNQQLCLNENHYPFHRTNTIFY